MTVAVSTPPGPTAVSVTVAVVVTVAAAMTWPVTSPTPGARLSWAAPGTDQPRVTGPPPRGGAGLRAGAVS